MCFTVLERRIVVVAGMSSFSLQLYDRAVDIISKVTQTKHSFAEECLKLSILRSSPLEEWDLPRKVLIERATEMQMVGLSPLFWYEDWLTLSCPLGVACLPWLQGTYVMQLLFR